MSDSVRPHRRQPTRLPRPWDSPGKNTGVGGHFLLQRVKVKLLSHVLATPWTAAHQAPQSMGFSRQEYWSGVLLQYTRSQKECFGSFDALIPKCDFNILTTSEPHKGKNYIGQPTPVLLPGKSHGLRSLEGCSP